MIALGMSRNTWKGQARKSRNTAGLASSNCKTQPLEEENRLCSTILQESEDRGNYTSSVTHLGDETLYGREYPQFKPRQLCNSTIRYLEPEPPLPGSEEVGKCSLHITWNPVAKSNIDPQRKPSAFRLKMMKYLDIWWKRRTARWWIRGLLLRLLTTWTWMRLSELWSATPVAP